MLLLRLFGLLALIAIGVSLGFYVWYRDPKFLRLAWQIFLGILAFALALVAFYAVERLLMAV